jgi:hypothetical protein
LVILRARNSTGTAPAMINAETMMTAYNTHGVLCVLLDAL